MFCHGLAVAFVVVLLLAKSHGTTVAEHLNSKPPHLLLDALHSCFACFFALRNSRLTFYKTFCIYKEQAEKLLRSGLYPSQIASEMGVSVSTVIQYLRTRVGEGALRLSG